MKMGEIRWTERDGFVMQTPGGIRPVTLRCTVGGEVHVEEVSGGGLSVAPLRITQLSRETSAADAAQIARAARAASAEEEV